MNVPNVRHWSVGTEWPLEVPEQENKAIHIYNTTVHSRDTLEQKGSKSQIPAGLLKEIQIPKLFP